MVKNWKWHFLLLLLLPFIFFALYQTLDIFSFKSAISNNPSLESSILKISAHYNLLFLFIFLTYFFSLGTLGVYLYRAERENIFLNESLSVLTHELSRIEITRSHFISMVSHEFRTPLARIGNFLQLIREFPQIKELPALDKLLTQITDSHNLLLRSLTNIISLTRIQNQEFKIEKSPENISKIIKEILDNFFHEAQLKNIQIKFADCHPGAVLIDFRALTLCLNNLMDNAIKYSPENGTIEFILSEEKNLLRFKIENCLQENAEIEVEKIFDRFYRGRHQGSAKNDGVGLGLFLVKYLAELQGGSIDCTMVENKITFNFWLPY